MHKPKLSNQGFTLIEVLLYLAIASVMLFAVSGFVVMSLQSRSEGMVATEVEQQGEKIMQTITKSIRESSTITSPTANNSSPSLTITTTIPATNPTVYSLNSGILMITEGASPAVGLNGSRVTISGLTFINTSKPTTSGSIKIQFTASYNGNISRREYNYSKVFYGTASLRY